MNNTVIGNYERARRLILVTLLFVTAAACSTNTGADRANDPLADQSFTSGQPCAAPCWYGLELDKSNSQDALSALKKLPFVDPMSVQQGTTPWLGDNNATVITWNCIHPKLDGCGNAQISQDRLKQLWLKVSYRLNFQTVVANLGQPDYVDYGYQDPSEGCLIFLGWPTRGITVYSTGNSNSVCQSLGNGNKLPADTLATNLVYSVKESFNSEPSVCCKRVTWPGIDQP